MSEQTVQKATLEAFVIGTKYGTPVGSTITGQIVNEPLNVTLDSEITVVKRTGEYYNGDYDATSLPFEDQTLDTEGKVMRNNFVVNRIPYAETSNLSGGYTAIIGG